MYMKQDNYWRKLTKERYCNLCFYGVHLKRNAQLLHNPSMDFGEILNKGFAFFVDIHEEDNLKTVVWINIMGQFEWS